MIFGIEDPWIVAAIGCSFLSVVLCVGYALVNWKEDISLEEQEMTMEEIWEKEEHEEVDKILD